MEKGTGEVKCSIVTDKILKENGKTGDLYRVKVMNNKEKRLQMHNIIYSLE